MLIGSSFGVLTPPILPFSIGLAGRPYNSVLLQLHVPSVTVWSRVRACLSDRED